MNSWMDTDTINGKSVDKTIDFNLEQKQMSY
jgi:hypothetical protein